MNVDDAIENYPSSFVSLDHFKRLVRNADADSALVLSDQTSRKYGIAWGSTPLDHYVAESLKIFDSDLYNSLRGFTKVPRFGRALHSLLKYAKPIHTSESIYATRWSAQCYHEALSDVRALFKGKRFETLTLKDKFKQLPTNTGAGSPYYCSKGLALHQCSINVDRKYHMLLRGEKIKQEHCLLALRGHLSPIDNIKTRAVMINSFDHIVLENILFRSMYDFVFNDKQMQRLILTGPNVMARLRNYLVQPQLNYYVNLDYSAWDTWKCRFAARDLFKILFEHINFKPGEERVAQFVQRQFLNSYIAMPDGSVFMKKSGTCTGSLITSLFNSLLNYLVLRTSIRYLEADHCVEDLKILGDDVGFFYSGGVANEFVEKLSQTLMYFFGLQLNAKKSLIVEPWKPVEDRKFIGYTIRNNQLYREEFEFFKYILYCERPVEDFYTSFSRVMSYFLLGGVSHQRFCRFFECYIGHYYRYLNRNQQILDENVFRIGNLRVIKHVFSNELDDFLDVNLTLESFRNWDFVGLPYKLTLAQITESFVFK